MSSIRFIIISLVAVIALLLVGCAGKSSQTAKESDRQPQPTDTLYTQKVAMSIYGYQPVWALQIIDSAVVVGNLSEVWADVNRARIYSQTQMKEQLDSLLGGPEGVRLDTARTIGERLLQHDSLKANSKLRQDVLEILVYTARQQQDTVRWLQRSRELVEECRKHGDEAKALAEGAGAIGRYFPDKAALLPALPALLRPGDTVLVKASRGMRFEEVTRALCP